MIQLNPRYEAIFNPDKIISDDNDISVNPDAINIK